MQTDTKNTQIGSLLLFFHDRENRPMSETDFYNLNY
jgi:hypothetical protein